MEIVHIGNIELGQGLPKIIAPITAGTFSEALTQARKIKSSPADMVEWRVDMFGTSPGNGLQSIVSAALAIRVASCKPVLATFRTQNEGGKQAIDHEDYSALYHALCQVRAVDAIDVEVFSMPNAKDVIGIAHACGIPVVASNHDFFATPDEDEIVRRLMAMQDDFSADILKMAVMPQSPDDVLTLLSATRRAANSARQPIITMSMGKLGTFSRICGQLAGSCATFGTVAESSAPGQLSAEELTKFLTCLEI